MIWFLFAIFSAFFSASYYALIKNVIKKYDSYILASNVFLLSVPIFLFFSFIKGFPNIGKDFFKAMLVTGSVNIFSTILYYKALEITDISLCMPMISFTPMFQIVTSALILNESPSLKGVGGIFLIVLGSYLLNLEKENKSIISPIKNIISNRGVFYMLIVSFLYSIASNYDKMLVQNSDPLFGHAFSVGYMGIVFAFFSLVQKKDIFTPIKSNFAHVFSISICLFLALACMNIAFTMQIVPYVTSIKRLSVVFSILLGHTMFKEENIVKRLFSALIMAAGAIMIIMFG